MTLISKLKTNYWLQCVLNSYSLIFFSNDNLFAICILIVSFFSPFVGLSGLGSIMLINLTAYFIGFNKDEIKSGLFGFNALFLGMAIGYEFNFNFAFVILFFSSIIILLLITVSLKGFLSSNSLPFLSFPFIITYWIVSLSATNFTNIQLDESHIYLANEAARNKTSSFYIFINSLNNISLFPLAINYLRTLAGTFFQTSILGGLIIAFGLLQFSRIAFSLSILGFTCAYFYYTIFGADVNDLNHNLLGANFIFLAIAIGCFFVIPNINSYITVIILTPVLLLTSLALTKVLTIFQIHSYSFSFSLITILFLFALHQRLFAKYLHLVTIQYYSAEKTIYKYLNSLQRFKNEHLYKISLPFIGEMKVSQGYNGKITHLGDWSKALDFVIENSKSNTYMVPKSAREGFTKDSFYCYNKEILSPFEGYVYDIINTVEENDIGDMDTKQNWGNTIILNHLNGLFSQISHIKKDSFGVFIGQYVTKGTYLARCGNSGRSPEPHIHFQLQTVPIVGAKTLEYPISYFIERQENDKKLVLSDVPKEGTFISNVQVNELLVIAFALLPGQKIKMQKENSSDKIYWEVFTDAINRTYIYCEKTKSYAYFVNDGTMFYFTDFEGKKASLLFQFYLATYRQLLGYYETIKIQDKVPLVHFNNKWIAFFQDFFAPFYLFTTANYTSTFSFADNLYAPQNLIINSNIEAKLINYTFKKISYELELKDHKIQRFTIHHKHKSESYQYSLQY